MRHNTQQFRALALSVREGSLSRAAARMGISQSAVSQHIAKLELLAGTKLLFRGVDGLALTKAGEEFYDLADRLVTLDAQIGEKIAGYAASQTGYLSIIANAPHPALPLISRFKSLYPGIEIDFSLRDWTVAMTALRDRQVDIGIVTAPDRIGSCYRHPLQKQQFVAYMRSDHPLASGAGVCLAQLAAHTFLLPEPGSLTERVVRKKLAELGISPRRLLRTHTFPVMVEAILEGLGVGVFLEDSIRPNAELATQPIRELRTTYMTELVCPANKKDLRMVENFLHIARSTP